MFEATKIFISSLNAFKSKSFLEKILLPAVRKDIQTHKKLNYHYYYSLKKSFFKASAWFKGILFPLVKVLKFYFCQ